MLYANDEIVLTWQKCAPAFSSDVDVYIWEQHKQLPPKEFVHILHVPQTDSDAPCLEFLFRSSASLQIFDYLRRDENVYKRSKISTTDRKWSATSEFILSVLAAFQVMIHDTTQFMRTVQHEIKLMVRAELEG